MSWHPFNFPNFGGIFWGWGDGVEEGQRGCLLGEGRWSNIGVELKWLGRGPGPELAPSPPSKASVRSSEGLLALPADHRLGHPRPTHPRPAPLSVLCVPPLPELSL